MCNTCGQVQCCCSPYIGSAYIPGPQGPMGIQGVQGIPGTNGTNGAQGIPGPVGPGANIESGSFSQSVVLGPGNKNIATVGTVKMLFITAYELVPLSGAGSTGKSNLLTQDCIYTDGISAKIDSSNCLHFTLGGNGWSGVITSFGASNGYVINFTQLGLGASILIKWHAIIA